MSQGCYFVYPRYEGESSWGDDRHHRYMKRDNRYLLDDQNIEAGIRFDALAELFAHLGLGRER